MPAQNPYCTRAEVQAEIRNASASNDVVDLAIESASRWIDCYLGRDFIDRDFRTVPFLATRFNSVIAGAELYLPYRPISSMQSVEIISGFPLTLGAEWQVDSAAGILFRIGNDWPVPERNSDGVRVFARFGYPQATVETVPTGMPAHVRRAAVLAASAATGLMRVDQIGLDGQPVTLTRTDIPDAVIQLLGKRSPQT